MENEKELLARVERIEGQLVAQAIALRVLLKTTPQAKALLQAVEEFSGNAALFSRLSDAGVESTKQHLRTLLEDPPAAP